MILLPKDLVPNTIQRGLYHYITLSVAFVITKLQIRANFILQIQHICVILLSKDLVPNINPYSNRSLSLYHSIPCLHHSYPAYSFLKFWLIAELLRVLPRYLWKSGQHLYLYYKYISKNIQKFLMLDRSCAKIIKHALWISFPSTLFSKSHVLQPVISRILISLNTGLYPWIL